MASDASDLLNNVLSTQTESLATLFGAMVPAEGTQEAETAVQWAQIAARMQSIWTEFQVEQLEKVKDSPPHYADPVKWVATAEAVFRQLPLANPEVQQNLWEEGLALTNAVLGQYGLGPKAAGKAEEAPELPRKDRRFADPEWRNQPFFAVLHQLYLLLSDNIKGMAASVEGLDPARKAQLEFATNAIVDALSPANFPFTNPVALGKASETKGESLVRGLQNMLDDMRKGQLTHSRPGAFVLGENIAVTPGKVVYETPLFQLIQYTPTTDKVLKTPLVIFPPWINRFYILDLNAKKSFVRWAV